MWKTREEEGKKSASELFKVTLEWYKILMWREQNILSFTKMSCELLSCQINHIALIRKINAKLYQKQFITYLNKTKLSKYISFDLCNRVEEVIFFLTTFFFFSVWKFSVEMNVIHSSTLQRLKSTWFLNTALKYYHYGPSSTSKFHLLWGYIPLKIYLKNNVNVLKPGPLRFPLKCLKCAPHPLTF